MSSLPQPQEGDAVLGTSAACPALPQSNNAVLGGIDGIKSAWSRAQAFEEKLRLLQQAQKYEKKQAIALTLTLIQELIVQKEQILGHFRKLKAIASGRVNQATITESEYYRLVWELTRSCDEQLQNVYQNVLIVARLAGAAPATACLEKALVGARLSINFWAQDWKSAAEQGVSLLVLYLTGEPLNPENERRQDASWQAVAGNNPKQDLKEAIVRIAESELFENAQSQFQAIPQSAKLQEILEQLNSIGIEQSPPSVKIKNEKSQFLQGVENMLKKRRSR